MKIFRSIAALGLVFAMGVSFAGCATNDGAEASDTTAPVVVEDLTESSAEDSKVVADNVTEASAEESKSDNGVVTEISGDPEVPAEDTFEQAMANIRDALGQDREAVKAVFESKLGAKLGSEETNKNDYFYATDVTIGGVQFTHVTLRTNAADGKVCGIDLVNDTSNTAECKSFVETFKKRLSTSYSDQLTPVDSTEYEGVKVSVGEGASCIVGGSYSANYNKFYLIFNAESA